MPDGLNAYQAGGSTYLVTANEGDAREWGDYVEPVAREGPRNDGSRSGVRRQPARRAHLGDAELGRLNVTKELGFDEPAGCYGELYAFGGRSFSIWTTDGALVFDSGDSFEEITHAANPEFFNSNHTVSDLEGRSDDKGPEPENLTIGSIGGRTYAFIGFERVGGIAVVRHHRPRGIPLRHLRQQPRLLGVGRRRRRPGRGALSRPATSGPRASRSSRRASSATGSPLLAVANEVSGTDDAVLGHRPARSRQHRRADRSAATPTSRDPDREPGHVDAGRRHGPR